MTQYPLISVVVPVYNAAKTIEKCVLSIKKQTYPNFEVILVDDGSRDQSLDICQKLVLPDKRIKVFHQENSGVSAARNHGIQEAKGDYICFIDSDDWIDKDYLEILFTHMSPKALSVCQISINDQRIDDDFLVKLSPAQAQISVLDCNGMQGFPFAKLFDLHLMQKNHLKFNEKITICEDVLFCIQYLSLGVSDITYVGKKPYHYIKTSQGATNSRFIFHNKLDSRSLSEIEAIRECYKYLLPNSDVHEACICRYTKAAVNTLRTLEANRLQSDDLYKALLCDVRKHYFEYVKSPYGVRSSKVSVVLSAISPKIELEVWRMLN